MMTMNQPFTSGSVMDGIEVRSLPRVGCGCFAQKSFDAGEVVLQDAPFATLTVHLPSMPTSLALQPSTASAGLDDLQQCLSSLQSLRSSLKELCATIVSYKPPDPGRYWSLLQGLTSPSVSSQHPVIVEVVRMSSFLASQAALKKSMRHWPDASNSGIAQTILTWMTNTLSYQGGSALFPCACRVNHCCKPNVIWDSSRGTFVAIRPIAQGDEICLSYLRSDGLLPFHRCTQLYQEFFFWCQCSECDRARYLKDNCRCDENARHAEQRIAEAILRGDATEPQKARQLKSLARKLGMSDEHFVVAELCRMAGSIGLEGSLDLIHSDTARVIEQEAETPVKSDGEEASAFELDSLD